MGSLSITTLWVSLLCVGVGKINFNLCNMFSKASHGSQIIKEYPTLTTSKGDTVLIIFSQNIGHYH